MVDDRDDNSVGQQAGDTHLTENDLLSFMTPGGMTDSQRLQALTHAATCPICQARIAGVLQNAGKPVAAVAAPRTGHAIVALATDSAPGTAGDMGGEPRRHLDYNDIVCLVNGELTPVERDLVEGHLEDCVLCVAAVEEQRSFQATLNADTALTGALSTTVEGTSPAREAPLPALSLWCERLSGALDDIRDWHRRQQEAMHGLLPAGGALTAAAAGNDRDSGTSDAGVFDVWESVAKSPPGGATRATALLLRLTRRDTEYRARVEYTVPDTDPARARYAERIVRVEIFDGMGEPVFASPREIAVGGSLLLGELQLSEQAIVLATVVDRA